MTPDLQTLMARQAGVFTFAQAMALGITADDLAEARRGGDVRPLRQGVFTTRAWLGEWQFEDLHRVEVAGALIARGALLDPTQVETAPPKFVVGHRSAALLWGLPAPHPPRLGAAELLPLGTLTTGRAVQLVSRSSRTRTFAHGVHVLPAQLPLEHVAVSGPLPITNLARTCLDIAREGDWSDAVIVCDAALRRDLAKADLRALLAAFPRRPGSRQAARAIDFANPLAESPAESLARVVFVELELPSPELQVELFDAHGLIGRVDMIFRAQRTVVEVDGEIKYSGVYGDPNEVRRAQEERERRLRAAGWEVVRVTWAELKANPVAIRLRVLAAFARGLARSA